MYQEAKSKGKLDDVNDLTSMTELDLLGLEEEFNWQFKRL